MGSQTVANNPLGSYPVIVDRNSTGQERQAVGIDIGTVTGDVLTESRVSATNPLPVTVVGSGGTSDVNIKQVAGQNVETFTDDFSAVHGYFPVGSKDGTGGTNTPRPLISNANGDLYTAIRDSSGNNIDSVADQIASTGKVGLLPMAYDAFNAEYGPIPLGSNGDSISCTLTYANTSIGVTPASNTVLGTITTSTGTVTTGNIDGYAGVSVICWGTHAGINLTPEVSSDGTNWDTATMTRTASATVNQATGVITSNATRAWYVPTGGIRFFRMRATAYTSGTLNVRITATLDALTQVVTSIPSGTTTVSGTVTANPILTTGAGATTNYKNLDLKATTGVNIKASKTFVAEMYAYNNTGATLYVKLYSKATAPTSADTPQLVYGVKAGEGVALLGGQGMELAAGFGARCTTGVADADNTDPAANGCVFSACYI